MFFSNVIIGVVSLINNVKIENKMWKIKIQVNIVNLWFRFVINEKKNLNFVFFEKLFL